MDSLLSQTVSEVLGQFRPGREAVVFASGSVAADIVAAHERAHTALTISSSFGRYLSALVTAMDAREDRKRFDELQALLEFGIEQCWVVQEAYATAAQQLYTELCHGAKAASEAKAGFLPAYRAALESLPDVRDAVRATLSSNPGRGAPDDFDALAEHMSRACLFVVAVAAMAVPVSRFFIAGQADLSGLSGWIRRNAPDARLPLLVQHCTPQRMAEWAVGFLRAALQSHDMGISHPRDAFLASASELLCDAAGLAYEASDAVDIQFVLRAIGSDVQVNEVDLRLVPLNSQSAYFNASIQLAPGRAGMAWFNDWSDAVAELRAFRLSYPGAVTTVVCEVMCMPENQEVRGALHLFVPSRLACLGRESSEANTSLSRPARVLSISFATDAPSLTLLADQFPNRAWCWLGSQAMFSGQEGALTSLLGAGSAAVYTVPTLNRYRDRRGYDDWAHFALPRTDAHPSWRVAGAPPDWEPAKLLIPQGSVLACRDHTEGEATFRSVELLAGNPFVRITDDVSYIDDCVAQVLAFGHYSLFSRIANEL